MLVARRTSWIARAYGLTARIPTGFAPRKPRLSQYQSGGEIAVASLAGPFDRPKVSATAVCDAATPQRVNRTVPSEMSSRRETIRWEQMRGFGLGVAGTTVKAITVPLEFSNVTETVPGQSVLVVGNIPHGGNWAPTYVTKLVPHDCSGSKFDRMAWIGIAPGTSFQYKFIKCNDRAICYADESNTLWEPKPNCTRTVPPRPGEDKTLFVSVVGRAFHSCISKR